MEEQKAEATVQESTPEVDPKVLAEQLEAIKRAQAGSDKAYAEAAKKARELEAELETLRKEKMTEKERAEFELAKKEAELEQRAREVAEATSRLSKIRLMSEKQIPAEFADYIHGSNDDEILESINTFTARFEKAVGDRVQKTLTGTQKPQAGAEPPKKDNLSTLTLAQIEAMARDGKL